MDLEELEGWLGEDDEGAGGGGRERAGATVKPLFADTGATGRTPARRSWLRIALLAGGVWLVVMAVFVTRGGGQDAPGGDGAPAPVSTTAMTATTATTATTAPTAAAAAAPTPAPTV